MTKEEAIKRIKARFDKLALDDKDIKAIQTLIPELHESEDERIRKEMIEFLNQFKEDGLRGVDITPWIAYLEKQKESLHIHETCKEKANFFTDEDERIKKEIIDFIQWTEDRGMMRPDYHQAKRPTVWIAYLENQKEEEGYEAIPVESTLEYKLGFKAGKESEKQKEQKPNCKYGCPLTDEQLMATDFWKAYLKDCLIPGGKPTKQDIEFLLPFARKYFSLIMKDACTVCKDWSNGYQKGLELGEQKPAEYADDVIEEAEEYTSKVACGDYGVEVTEAYIAGVLSERNRGTEWSENDEAQLDDIEKAISNYYDLNHAPQHQYWLEQKLKSLRLQSKQGWSEKDNIMLENIILCLKEYCLTDEITWLKSLRPPLKDKEMKLKILKYLSTRCSSLEFEEVEDYLNNLRPS